MCLLQVVPGVILLLILPLLCNGENVKFGTRVEQATNLCRSHEACRFGYSFADLETDLLTSESRTSEEESKEAVKTIRRRPRINIDPRRKSKNNRGVSVTESPKSGPPVTIKIGGESIVIPDFDIRPQTTTTSPPPTKKLESRQKASARPRGQKKRNKNNRRKNKPSNNRPSRLNKTKVLKLFGASSINKSSSRSRKKTTTTSNVTVRPTSLAPSSSTSSTLINTITILDSFSTLQRTVTETSVFQSFTTVRPRTPPSRSNRGRGTTSERPGTTQPVQRPLTTLPSAQQEKICPESLGKCVDACVPLQDIYAYSACVVECGERCPVVLVR